VPARRPSQSDICPHTGRARLGYDRARILLAEHTGGWTLHQLRHSVATHLGDKKVPLQLIMAKTRHRSPRTVMRYVNPGPEAVAQITDFWTRPIAPSETTSLGLPGSVASHLGPWSRRGGAAYE